MQLVKRELVEETQKTKTVKMDFNVCKFLVYRITGNTWGALQGGWCWTIWPTKRNWEFWVSQTRYRSTRMDPWSGWVVQEVVNKSHRPFPFSFPCLPMADRQLVPYRNPVWLAPWPKLSPYVFQTNQHNFHLLLKKNNRDIVESINRFPPKKCHSIQLCMYFVFCFRCWNAEELRRPVTLSFW